MNRTPITLALCAGLAVAGCGAPAQDPGTAASTPTSVSSSSTAGVASANTVEVVAATKAFLTTLSDEQRQRVLLDLDDAARKAGWSNLPSIAFERPGIALGDLDDAQRQAVMAVLEAALSDEGYEEVQEILVGDDYLGRVGTVEGAPAAAVFGSDYYNIAVFGEPSEESPFALQFGGHHVAQTLTYSGGNVSMAPELIGVEPLQFEGEGTTYQPMADEGSVIAVLDGLTPEQRTAAELSGEFDDLLLGPQTDGPFPSEPEGQLVSELSQEQQDAVTTAVRAWVGDVDEEAAEALLARYTSEYDQTYLGWSGGTALDDVETYIRIDGPALWIEFSNQEAIAVDGIHHHTIYRDQTADYGGRGAP